MLHSSTAGAERRINEGIALTDRLITFKAWVEVKWNDKLEATVTLHPNPLPFSWIY